MAALQRGAVGSAVAEVRSMLATIGLLDNTNPATVAVFDEPTELAVRHFQQRRGLSVNGAVGAETFTALTGAHWRLGDRVLAHTSGSPLAGDDVTQLQTQLLQLGYNLGRADGVFGRLTADALRSFQRDYGLVPDAVCGPATLRALRQLGRRVVGGRPQLLREMVRVVESGPSLLGKRVILDPGHGGADRGVRYGDVAEADLAWEMATRLEGRLQALGVVTWMTRGRHTDSSEAERAELANELGADLVLSLHLDGSRSPRANGLAAYYYGAGETGSTIGERLADLMRRELVARTGLLDGRIHGKTWELLRLTRMPAVRVELGYLTSPVDRPRLLDPLFRDTMAEGMLVAIQRLYLPQADDPPTGVLKMPVAAS